MIFFDIDDTLLNHSKAQRTAALLFWDMFSAKLPYPRHEFPDLWNTVMQRHFDAFAAGRMSFQEQRGRRIEEVFGFNPGSYSDTELESIFDSYLELYEASWELFDDVLPCLKSLSHLRLGIISNGNGLQQRLKLDRLGIATKFTTIVISEEIGVWKPSQEIFQEACRQASIAPQECIFIGDNLKIDAQASAGAGMHGIWLNRYALNPPAPGVRVINDLTELSSMVA